MRLKNGLRNLKNKSIKYSEIRLLPMIVKIKSHKKPTFRKLLDYMINDKDRLFDKSGNSFCVTHNLKGSEIEIWEKQLKQNEMHRKHKRSNSVYFTHEILSWHREDAKNIFLGKLESMTRQYIQLRNPKGIYIATPHFDRDHVHVHILVSGIEYKSGKGMRLSKTALLKLKEDIQNYQLERFPELTKSVVAHERKKPHLPKMTEKEYQIKYRTGRETEKEKVFEKINECYTKATSKENFFQLLKELKLITYERNGKLVGIIHNKYKFRFNRLGFTEIKLEHLNRALSRKQELKQSRSKSSILNIRRER